MHKIRFVEIDELRGIAMFAMILIHTNAYYLSDKIAAFLWDMCEFAVPIFIFCSAYIFFSRELSTEKETKWLHVNYFKKRFLRLLVPYYIFALIFFFAILVKDPKTLTTTYVTQSLLITGGIDINWLVILFLEFTFLMPLLASLYRYKKVFFYLFTICSFGAAVTFLVTHIDFNYKWVMWLPWSLLLIYTIYFLRFQKKYLFFFSSCLISLIVFFFSQQILQITHHSLTQYANKYPPNIYHLSYGIVWIAILYMIARAKVFRIPIVKQLLSFLSLHSYQIYFIHYVILYLATDLVWKYHVHWSIFFLFVLSISIVAQIGIIRGQKAIQVITGKK